MSRLAKIGPAPDFKDMLSNLQCIFEFVTPPDSAMHHGYDVFYELFHACILGFFWGGMQ